MIMSIKKSAVKKDERKVNFMNGRKEAVESMGQNQLTRIAEHPLQINRNMVVLDNLEKGALRIFEPDGPVYVKHLSGVDYITGAKLVGEIRMTFLLEEKGVLINHVSCEKGYEELARPMIDQVKHFVEFYDEFEKVGMVDSVHQKWGF